MRTEESVLPEEDRHRLSLDGELKSTNQGKCTEDQESSQHKPKHVSHYLSRVFQLIEETHKKESDNVTD